MCERPAYGRKVDLTEKKFKEVDMETEHMDSASKMEITKFLSAFMYILKYLGQKTIIEDNWGGVCFFIGGE